MRSSEQPSKNAPSNDSTPPDSPTVQTQENGGTLLGGDSEGTARKTAACRLAVGLIPLLSESTAPSRSELARRLGVVPSAVTQALNPTKYDTNLPLLERITDALGYEAVITYKVDVTVSVRRQEAHHA